MQKQNKNRFIDQIWKCLPIYEDFGQKSYEIYLAKTIGRLRASNLEPKEREVLKELESLYQMGDILTHDALKSIILSCTNALDSDDE